ncbi:MAG: hypothetical protein FWD77_02145 [Betaproteobacteria bacterium]|nr:hypothetical protein [Betaproteobacteria bacterium]
MTTNHNPTSNGTSSETPPASRRRSFDIESIRKLAEAFGGQCLSEKYTRVHQKLIWQCRKGHIWEADSSQILRGRWCAKCRMERLWEGRLEKLRAAAKAKGGECLTTEYTGYRGRLLWRCGKGHIWQARSDGVLGRSWCPICGNEKKRTPLSELQALAKQRGGKCLTTEYVGMSHKMLWQCGEGHLWRTSGNKVQRGSWCPACVHQSLRLTIESMQEIARSRGGFCLSTKYIKSSSKLNWQCAHGHVWSAAPGHVKSGQWCPTCARRTHINRTIEDMQKLAHERGGRCLSKEYLGTVHKLSWQCKLGHVWKTTPAIVMRGSWCPECYYLNMCLSDKAREKYLRAGSLEKAKRKPKRD